ncbi:cation channel family transporter [Geopyxis carbonaria]|nr:cation channel family transporter [Geopyxis carbonaria]
MLSTLFRAKKRRPRASSAFSSIAVDSPGPDRETLLSYQSIGESVSSSEDEPELSPLLPIFAAHLDSIPVYNLVHAIRSDIVSRVDTTLTWSQLRTPQVSSFVVKPILGNLMQMENELSKGILYSLMANCLQFRKEAQENPGSAGTSSTRAYLCELLAIKCLKEFTPRELIDALSYDFYPLQGMPEPTDVASTPIIGGKPNDLPSRKRQLGASRISTLELAIRAQAKKFLSHPAVVQQLQAIWAGNVVFYSLYDRLQKTRLSDNTIASKDGTPFRRSATIYDGRDASLFKLSRLRVPRYRHILSTISLTILLLLHLLVLKERSPTITPLEVTFWLWSCGFMIDEMSDFNESGVSLYLMSLWNTFDIGIFLLFVTFYIMRIAGLFMPEERGYMTDWAFDILASCSIFLFPRIFSVLDHYRYFSQLIIAFRIMAVDMLALLILILVACSGFFVAFTFSFARESSSGSDVSYALFQILLGFTPAAWESWGKYNFLGKLLLTVFLIICHFLIVTILITVLTNSFAAVAANAQEEHQFLVAVNTISLVKNEALFTYVAPTNLIAWVLHPLRYFLPFRKYVRVNRQIVKITHFPILLIIYLYESTILRGSIFTPGDVITNQKPVPRDTIAAMRKSEEDTGLLSPVVRRRLRRDSVGSRRQERVLEEVFRKPYLGATARMSVKGDDQEGQVVNTWMNDIVPPTPPTNTDTDADPLAMRRRPSKRGRGGGLQGGKDTYGATQMRTALKRLPPRDFSMTRSAVSDPEEHSGTTGAYKNVTSEAEYPSIRTEDDADNEENSAAEDTLDDEEQARALELALAFEKKAATPPKIFERRASTPPRPSLRHIQTTNLAVPSASSSSGKEVRYRGDDLYALQQSRLLKGRSSRHHSRTNSSNTILFRPPTAGGILSDGDDDDDLPTSPMAPPMSRKASQRTEIAPAMSRRASRRTNTESTETARQSRPQTATRPRPIMPNNRQHFQSVPDLNLNGLQYLDEYGRRRSASGGMSDLENEPDGDHDIGLIPSSFATQMAMATGRGGHGDMMLNRLVLARIGALEESVKDVKDILKEVKRLKKKDKEEKKEKEKEDEEKRGRKLKEKE